MSVTQNIFQPIAQRSLVPSAPPLIVGGLEAQGYVETASQTYGVADLLYLDSNGTVAKCTVDGSARLNSKVLGLAEQAAVGTAGTPAKVRVLTPWDVVLMNVYHATLASSVTAQTQLGTVLPIQLVNSIWRVDLTVASPEGNGVKQGYVTVVGFPTTAPDGTKSTIGDTHGLVWVRFNEWTISADGVAQLRILQGA